METDSMKIWEYHIAEPKKIRQIHYLLAEQGNKSSMALLARNVKRVVIDRLLDETLTEAIVPKELDGYPVIEIADKAFRNCTQLESVEFPDTVGTIHGEVFAGCENLKRVRFPESIDRVGHGLFKDCTGLTEMELPCSLKTINFEMFQGCTSLRKVILPEEIFFLGNQAFEGCVSLETIELPEQLKKIEIGVFRNCKSLQELRIPDSVSEIGDWAFEGCTGLKEISLPEGIIKIEKRTFQNCSSLERIRIPASVINIGTDRLNWITAMKDEDIGKVVQDNPLEGCDNLKEICVYAGSCAEIWAKENDYQHILFIEELPVEYFLKEETQTAVISGLQKRNMDKLVIPGVIENHIVVGLANEAFAFCDNLTSVVLPETVQVIGEGAFRMCSNLLSLYLPASVRYIDDTAIVGCTEFEAVYIKPDSYAEQWAMEHGLKVIPY